MQQMWMSGAQYLWMTYRWNFWKCSVLQEKFKDYYKFIFFQWSENFLKHAVKVLLKSFPDWTFSRNCSKFETLFGYAKLDCKRLFHLKNLLLKRINWFKVNFLRVYKLGKNCTSWKCSLIRVKCFVENCCFLLYEVFLRVVCRCAMYVVSK